MIRSMTGFAEKRFDGKSFSVKIQIKSLNHRFFDWNFRGNHFGQMENTLRELTQKSIQRGRIDVVMEMKALDRSHWDIEINEALLATLLDALRKAVTRKQKDLRISVDNLLSLPHIVEIRRKRLTAGEIQFLEKCFSRTLEELISQKKREGRDILKAIKGHVQSIKQSIPRLLRKVKRQPSLIKIKLQDRMKELLTGLPAPEEKLVLEASFLAQRYDLSEEIERLQSHLDYMQTLFSLQMPDPVGKKMDFIAQEIFREVNTLNAKAQDAAIIRECLAIKGEIESIRQQAQNLE